MLPEVPVALQCFGLGLGIISVFFIPCNGLNWLAEILPFEFVFNHLFLIFGIIYIIGFVFIFYTGLALLYKDYKWKVAARAAFLGIMCGLGIIVSILGSSHLCIFGWYIIIMSIFHFSEFLCTAIMTPSSVSLDSFLLNHSLSYHIAAFGSWVEFFIELYYIPSLKSVWYVSLLGVLICIVGEFIRKLAMITAGTNFNHIVQVVKHEEHVLVTWGIYSVFRHPSYVGWFYWSIGTQVVLANPVCFVIYVIVSWLFFNNRIYHEERTLVNFFDSDYVDYQSKTKIGLPFIQGFVTKV